ncbi:hypothetical protein SAMN05192558_10214 [Actinokineospora alba]|uniref:Uncharacterized protein n=1 Tax=Actinokineospora alba TaxID=504798 RepID=A0A1H0H8M8_9PSEU|nr:hypothetical protein [Actinokineospora alba]TDP64988.1 hypothetical protein C8E96_0466 [Actinokineospora alba]SDH51286.1 hypothetical protein SAMN05421871_101289 [Actinokineospora alba]SDO15529.1 hypothetical protein SAMN05192558_10214 [Actinokineospora alba]
MSFPESSSGRRATPTFPPRPLDDSRTPSLILSALPDVLPESLRREEPTPPPRRTGPSRPAIIKIVAAVVLVATLVGLGVWALTDSEPAPPAPVAQHEFTFTRAAEPAAAVLDSDCADHAYGQTKRFLATTACQQLTRALFTTTLSDGRVAYSSVAVVRMRSDADATALFELVRKDNTGSIADIVRDRAATAPGLDRLSKGGFAADKHGNDVVIVESDTATKDSDPEAHRNELKRVSRDALRLGRDLK